MGVERVQERLLVGEGGKIANPVPVECHDPGRSKLLPSRRSLARGVKPVLELMLLGLIGVPDTLRPDGGSRRA